MEALQAYTYGVNDDCTMPSNQVATLLGYLHITFQPFFINLISIYFIPNQVRKRIEPLVYTAHTLPLPARAAIGQYDD